MAEKQEPDLGDWVVIEEVTPESRAETVAEAVPPQPETVAPDTVQGQLGSVTVMLYGVFGGVYLLYTWGWALIIGAYSQINELTAVAGGFIGAFLQTAVFYVALLASPLWYVVGFALWGRRKPHIFVAALLLGMVLLAPLPLFVSTGAA